MANNDSGVEIRPSTFGLYDVWVWGEIERREVPLVLAQALAYCLEHGIEDPGWLLSDPLDNINWKIEAL